MQRGNSFEGSNPSLSENLKAPFWVLFKFSKSGVKQTALLHVGIRRAEPYPSLSEAKGEDGEPRPGGKIRQNFYRRANHQLLCFPSGFRLGKCFYLILRRLLFIANAYFLLRVNSKLLTSKKR